MNKRSIMIVCLRKCQGELSKIDKRGMPWGKSASFWQSEVQRCVIHQIRYSMSYVNSEDSKPFMNDLKAIYQAKTLEIAEENLVKLEEKWMDKYLISVRSWKNNWEELSTYFVYSHHLRRIIYTTNTIESYNRQLRKVTKKWNQPVHNWGQILGQFDAFFPNKVEKYMKN